MYQSQPSPTAESVKVHPGENAVPEDTVSQSVQPSKPSLSEEIARGWKWVIFVLRLLPRLGGVRGIFRTLSLVVSLLITRLLTQWGWIKKK